MSYSKKVPTYDIDLCTPPSQRWAEVIESEEEAMLALGKEMIDDVRSVSSTLLSPTLHKIFDLSYKMFGGHYQQEMRYLAKGLGIPASLAVTLNCTYELSHLLENMTPFGCTAGVKWLPGVGNIHVRNMDWPIRSIGPATCVFRYFDEDREFVSVGIAGLVGVLSGMIPGTCSVTINWAPSTALPGFNWGPLFLLRHVLETCDTYDGVVSVLAESSLSTSVFFTVCGTRRGEACVIERTPGYYAIREMGRRDVLVQANHHVVDEFLVNNENLHIEEEGYETIIDSSTERSDELEKSLRRSTNYNSTVRALNKEPVLNEFSYQRMVFVPKSGRCDVWRWV